MSDKPKQHEPVEMVKWLPYNRSVKRIIERQTPVEMVTHKVSWTDDAGVRYHCGDGTTTYSTFAEAKAEALDRMVQALEYNRARLEGHQQEIVNLEAAIAELEAMEEPK